jgi:hypothetical protein
LAPSIGAPEACTTKATASAADSLPEVEEQITHLIGADRMWALRDDLETIRRAVIDSTSETHPPGGSTDRFDGAARMVWFDARVKPTNAWGEEGDTTCDRESCQAWWH